MRGGGRRGTSASKAAAAPSAVRSSAPPPVSTSTIDPRAWEEVPAKDVIQHDTLKVRFDQGEGVEWCTCEVWRLLDGPRDAERATLIYHFDGYKEDRDLADLEFRRLREGVPRPSVLLQAGSHDRYYLGLLARSSKIKELSLRSSIKASPPFLVLANAKEAKLFDTHVMQVSWVGG